MAKIRKPKLTPAVPERLRPLRATGDPKGGKVYAGRPHRLQAFIRSGGLETGRAQSQDAFRPAAAEPPHTEAP
jgi:hypothetical protein